MKVTRDDLEELKALLREQYKREFSDKETKEIAIRLVNLFSLLSVTKARMKYGIELKKIEIGWSDFEETDDDAWREDLPKPTKQQ